MGSSERTTSTASASAAIADHASGGDEGPASGGAAPAKRQITVDGIRFDALRNAIYHSSRRGFLDSANRCLSFLVVIGGTAAVADLGETLNVSSAWFAAIAATAGLVQLVFDFGGKARTHEFLQRRFYELVAEVAECEAAKELDCIRRWDAELHRLYAEELPPMRALDAIAFNAAVDSLGKGSAARIPMKWYQSLLRQIWPFNEASF